MNPATRRRLTTIARVLAAAGLGVAIAVDAVRGSGGGEERRVVGEDGAVAEDLVGPLSPEPGALPGRLIVLRGERCVLQVADLERLRMGRAGPGTGCELTASPSGDEAVIPSSATRGQRVVRLLGAELEGRPEVTRDYGEGFAELDFSSDGSELAVCVESAETHVVTVESGEQRTLPGCRAAFAPDGAVLTLVPEGEESRSLLLREGATLLDSQELSVQFGTRIVLRAFDVSPDGTVAVLVRVPTDELPDRGDWRPFVLVVRDGEVAAGFAIDEPRDFAEEVRGSGFVRFSPDGGEIAIGAGGPGRIEIRETRDWEVTLGPLLQRGFDWSPDGAWLAISTGDRVDVYGLVRNAGGAYSMPLSVNALAGRPGEQE